MARYKIALVWTRSGNWAKVELNKQGLQPPSDQKRNGVVGSAVYVEVEASSWAEATTRLQREEGKVRQLPEVQAQRIAQLQERLPPLPAPKENPPEWWTARLVEVDVPLPEEISETNTLPEGAVRRVSVNAYERNKTARKACIAHYGPKCRACGFDFGEVYGPVAKEHIHVHHLTPVSTIGKKYIVDPIEDLRPVCANCHSIIHLGGKLRSIEEVRSLVAANT